MGVASAVQFASFAPSVMSITKAFLPGIENARHICTFFVPVNDGKTNRVTKKRRREEEAAKRSRVSWQQSPMLITKLLGEFVQYLR